MKNEFCECGCREIVSPDSRNRPRRFINGHNARGKCSGHWRGGRIITNYGYVRVLRHGHPRADSKGYVFEHILVLEKALKRPILLHESTHHIDQDRANNATGNLMLFASKDMHEAYHSRLRAFEASGHYDWRQCPFCHGYSDPKTMEQYGKNYCHAVCRNKNGEDRRRAKSCAISQV